MNLMEAAIAAKLGGGGGGGEVSSVNGQTGAVVLTAADLDDSFKDALLQIAEKVAYVDDQGATYYQALLDALYPLDHITAVYVQSGTVYDTDSLDSLKTDLTVTAYYEGGNTATVAAANYTLSGTLTAGTSTITVSYGGKTTTFTVVVTHSEIPSGYTAYDYVRYTGSSKQTASEAEMIMTQKFSNVQNLKISFDVMPMVAHEGSAAQILGCGITGSGASADRVVAVYGRTDTKRVSSFLRGATLYVEDIPGMVVNNLLHVTINPNDNGKSSLSVDELSYSAAWSSTYHTINSKVALFGSEYEGGTNLNMSNFVAIGNLQFYDLSDVLVGKYIPCVRNFDNVIGLYDTVTETFYTAATTTFTTIGNTNCEYAVGNWEVE